MTARKQYEPAESRLVAEFLAARFPDRRTIQHVRVGAIESPGHLQDLTPEEQQLVGAWRRWVDALVVEDRRLWVIEGGIVPDPGDISRLVLYCRLVTRTPELQEFWDLTVRGMLVYAVTDPAVAQLATEAGLVVEIYHPSWVDDYLNRLSPRARRAPIGEA